MRHVLLAVTIVLAVGLAASHVFSAGAPAPGNLISNSSLEKRSGPRRDYPQEPWGYGLLDTLARSPFADWGFSGYFDGGDYDIKLGKGHTGKHSARLVCRKKARAGICTDIIRVKPGTKLRFRGFFRAIDAKGKCFVNFEGDPGEGWARIDLPKADNYDWTEVTGVVTVKPPRGKRKADADGNVRIVVFIYTKAYGELWIDDVSLTPVRH